MAVINRRMITFTGYSGFLETLAPQGKNVAYSSNVLFSNKKLPCIFIQLILTINFYTTPRNQLQIFFINYNDDRF